MKSLHNQNGVALAIVVWFLAAMSLLVSGIVFQAKIDTRMAQLHAAKAKAVAAGDGAISLMLASIVSGGAQQSTPGQLQQPMNFEVGPHEVTVSLVPVSGLIDLNSASPQMLASLFQVHGGLSEVDAQITGDTVVNWRATGGDRGGRPTRFSAIEDVLRVDGVNRGVLDGIRDSIAVGNSRRSAIDWSQAPQSVLDVLAKLNPDKALKQFDRIAAGQSNTNNNRLSSIGSSSRSSRLGSYRVDALVRVGDQIWLRRRWAASGTTGAGKLPWRFVRTEAPRVLQTMPLAKHT